MHRKTRARETLGGPSSIYLRGSHCKCVSKDPRARGGPTAGNDLRKQPSRLTLGWGSVCPHPRQTGTSWFGGHWGDDKRLLSQVEGIMNAGEPPSVPHKKA